MKNLKSLVFVSALLVVFQIPALAQYSRFVPMQRNTISASIGGGLIMSEIQTPGNTYSTKGGLDWRVEYTHTFKNGIGFGAQYSGFHTGFDEGFDADITYIAPQFVYRIQVKSVIFSAGAGIGYANYKESAQQGNASLSTSGVGLNFNGGVEFMVSKNVGIGATIGSVNVFTDNTYDSPYNNDSALNGFARINILGGIRFYF